MPVISRTRQNEAQPAGARSQGVSAGSPGAIWLPLQCHKYSSSGWLEGVLRAVPWMCQTLGPCCSSRTSYKITFLSLNCARNEAAGPASEWSSAPSLVQCQRVMGFYTSYSNMTCGEVWPGGLQAVVVSSSHGSFCQRFDFLPPHTLLSS